MSVTNRVALVLDDEALQPQPLPTPTAKKRNDIVIAAFLSGSPAGILGNRETLRKEIRVKLRTNLHNLF